MTLTTANAAPAPVMSTCRHCHEPIIAGAPGGPSWLHIASRRAGCFGGLPIAEPESPVAPAVQVPLFDLPPTGRIGGVR